MNSPVEVTRGVRALRRLLDEQTFDLRDLEPAEFRDWLDYHLARWRRDPVFLQRARIRDLRRSHSQLRIFEREHRRAVAADAGSAFFSRLGQLERELVGTARAITGLAGALEQTGPQKRSDLRRKLQAFRAKQRTLRAEQARLIRSSAERQAMLHAQETLHRFRCVIGLEPEQARLEQLQRQRGHRSGRSGSSFERTALSITQTQIVPSLLRKPSSETAARVRVLKGVTLGAARIEFDQLVVRLPRSSGRSVQVLAVVEAKRNINDLAHGFRQRQENLAWLTGDAANYDPVMHRTRSFPTGHFDREAIHQQDGEAFRFTRESFRLFRRSPRTDWFLDRLYFITRPGTLWGLSTAALSRISFRVSTDENWEPASDAYLRKLRHWCQSLAKPIETPDVLRAYASAPRWGRLILLV